MCHWFARDLESPLHLQLDVAAEWIAERKPRRRALVHSFAVNCACIGEQSNAGQFLLEHCFGRQHATKPDECELQVIVTNGCKYVVAESPQCVTRLSHASGHGSQDDMRDTANLFIAVAMVVTGEYVDRHPLPQLLRLC